MLDDEPARGLRQGADPPRPRELIAPEPSTQLPPAAKSYWRTVIAINVGWALLGSMLASSAFEEIGVSGWVLPIVLAVLGAVAVVVIPELRHRRWRYDIRDDEIDIRHGTFTVRRTLIPIRRIQHVDTEAGPLQSMFDVATVKFHTAAGASAIPAVDKGEADAIRRRVADMTRTRDDV